jgi:hypothetical protein
MKAIPPSAFAVCGAALLSACGGTKDTAATVPATHGEFDSASGSWKPLSKVVTPPPHEQGAVITEHKGPGMMDKVGSTLKKPLQWVGLAKDEPQPAPAGAATVPTVKKTASNQ